CRQCGHVFQNPRLSLAGLDFYYRDFYEGEGQDVMEGLFLAGSVMYRARAEFARGHMEAPPTRWLDVGSGHGHFCLAAAGIFEQTTFEALDMSDAVHDAERRGWIARGYQGMFPDVALGIEERYDVVSMFHYLEHTREPVDEIRAAHRVLRPNGHLVIE